MKPGINANGGSMIECIIENHDREERAYSDATFAKSGTYKGRVGVGAFAGAYELSH
jgi:hypothetical protein